MKEKEADVCRKQRDLSASHHYDTDSSSDFFSNNKGEYVFS